MDKFAGSIAIVTGGSAGIGKALIKRLLEKSSDLTVIGIARRPIDEFSSFPNFRNFQCDVSKADQIQKMISAVQSEFPGKSVQILVNNAGHGKPLPLIDHSSLNDPATIEVENLEDVSNVFASQLNTNVLGLSLMTRAVRVAVVLIKLCLSKGIKIDGSSKVRQHYQHKLNVWSASCPNSKFAHVLGNQVRCYSAN